MFTTTLRTCPLRTLSRFCHAESTFRNFSTDRPMRFKDFFVEPKTRVEGTGKKIAAVHVKDSQKFRNFSTDRSWQIKEIFEEGYEQIVSVQHPSGLKAIVVIDSTELGPALGGLRIYPYASFEKALLDGLRLGRGMKYKSALAGIGLGGGKSVWNIDPKNVTEEMLKAYAAFLNTFKGRYITAEDVGSTVKIIDFIARYSPYVTGRSDEKSSGNPSPFTAWGVYRGIQATCKELFGSDSVEGRKITLQGLGSVGERVAEILFWHGAELAVADIDVKKTDAVVRKYHAVACAADHIHRKVCDIFVPCALGGILNSETISELGCKAVAGAANNQLLDASHADALQKRGILYAPDFAINAGGIINISFELGAKGYQAIDARNAVDRIYTTIREIFELSNKTGITTHEAAVSLAESKIKNKVGMRTTPPVFHHIENQNGDVLK